MTDVRRCHCGESPIMISSPIGSFCSFTCMGDHIQELNRQVEKAYQTMADVWKGMNDKTMTRIEAMDALAFTMNFADSPLNTLAASMPTPPLPIVQS